MTTNNEKLIARDGENTRPWQQGLNQKDDNSNLPEEIVFDALIVGGGLTGLTAALLLQNAGRKVVIAEAHTAGYGTTGGTSAHINTFADTTYKEAESAFGKDGAKLFAEAITEGVGLLKANITNYRIDCDFEPKTGFIYAEDEAQVKELDKVFEGAKEVGIAAAYTTKVPTPVKYLKALEFPDQAQFHPLKYLLALKDAFQRSGGIFLENTLIESIENNGEIHTGIAGERKISAKNVVYATHIPPGINSYSLRCAPYRSYVLGVKLQADAYPDALIYDLQEPYHYVRTHVVNGDKLLIIGGNDHKTGHDDPQQAFDDLEKYVRQFYPLSEISFQWSSQYYVPVDGFPYIGQMPEASKGTFCATGYNGNGMMLGSIAGKILADLIQGKESKYEKIFSPSRLKPVAGFKAFVEENADVAYHFVADRFGVEEMDSLKAMAVGSGKVVEIDGNKVAAYRDETGNIHALNPVCTHAGCIVNWNGEEKSWDCPCHGARYDIDGQVLTGPATLSLAKIDLEDHE